VVQSHVSYR